MQRLTQLCVVVTTVLSVGAIAATVASAEEGGAPNILPAPTVANPLRFVSASGIGTLTGSATIICLRDTGSGQFTGQRLGTISIDFKECALGTVSCHSEGDAAGIILVSNADLHLAAGMIGGVLHLITAMRLASTLLVKCGVLMVQIRGSVAGLALSIASLVKTKAFSVEFAAEKGKQDIKECELDKEFCEGKKFFLESEDGKGFVEGSLETTDELTLEKEAEIHF